MRKSDHCSPGSHPHADRPNWQLAETIDQYIENCREGLEEFSDRRAAKLLGWKPIEVWRAKMVAAIPDDLFDVLLDQSPVPSIKALAQIGYAWERGGNAFAEIERCPHCGGVLRKRPLISNKFVAVINQWLSKQAAGVK
jgi:hypothetical protein